MFPAPQVSDPFTPHCPKCKASLDGIHDAGVGACGACATPLEFVLFPALWRSRPVARAVRSVDGEATCYFHAQNQAAAICEGCGRYVCAVCEVPGDEGQKLCPPCVSEGRKAVAHKADEVTTYDTIALALVFFPLLLWPLTLLTAPVALGVTIYGWKQPRSLIRPGSGRLITAGVLASLQIAAWGAAGLWAWAH